MSRLAESALPPEDYEHTSDARGELAVLRDLASGIGATGFGLGGDVEFEASGDSGRGALRRLVVEEREFLVKRFTHGGLLRALTRANYSRPERPFLELKLSARLRTLGFDTPLVVAACARCRGARRFELELVIERVPNSRDLGFLLAELEAGQLERAQVRQLLGALGELVGRLHQAGFVHGDLQPNNVLAQGARLWILDLDKSRFEDTPLADSVRWTNLARLYRHVARRERERGKGLSRADYARFMRTYERALGNTDEASKRKADWRGVARSVARRAPFSSLGWAIDGRRRHTRDPRAG